MVKIFTATEACGCITAAHIDDGSATLGEWIVDWMRSGRRVTCIEAEEITIPQFCAKHFYTRPSPLTTSHSAK